MTQSKQVMIFGTFDTVHKGHEFFVKEAGKYGDVTIVVARDKNVKKIKSAPLHNERLRFEFVKKGFPNCHTVLGNKRDPYAIIRKYKPNIICLGYDQRSFDTGLEKAFPDIKVIRIASFKPEIYKSSKILT